MVVIAGLLPLAVTPTSSDVDTQGLRRVVFVTVARTCTSAARAVGYAGRVRRSIGRGRARAAIRALATTQTAGGVVLLACAVVALAWANAPFAESYFALWHTRLPLAVPGLALTKTLDEWVNDGLMAVFFLLVGLEIKRELLTGALASPRRAALPVVAAAGGMAVPALLYAAVTAGTPAARGWGVPMATDIAFTLAVLTMLGDRVPAALRVFVTAVAIVDDLGAVLVIGLFYTGALSWPALAAAAGLLLVLVAVNAAGVGRAPVYVGLGVALWLAVLESGVHATIAGVLLAMTIPARRRDGERAGALLPRMEHALQPWVTFGIMPVFALANAGVALGAGTLSTLADGVSIGVLLGLVAGKPIGIMLFTLAAVRARVAALPANTRWRAFYGASALCGIGFTMSLFIADLAFGEGATLATAKLAILTASLVAGLHGYAVLRRR